MTNKIVLALSNFLKIEYPCIYYMKLLFVSVTPASFLGRFYVKGVQKFVSDPKLSNLVFNLRHLCLREHEQPLKFV